MTLRWQQKRIPIPETQDNFILSSSVRETGSECSDLVTGPTGQQTRLLLGKRADVNFRIERSSSPLPSFPFSRYTNLATVSLDVPSDSQGLAVHRGALWAWKGSPGRERGSDVMGWESLFWKKADTFLCLHLLLEGCPRTSLLSLFVFPHCRLNLFQSNLNLCNFVLKGSNRLKRTSSFPVLIHLIDLKRIIPLFICYLPFHYPWLKIPVSPSLCLEDRLLIPLAVSVVSSRVCGELSLAFCYHLL